MSRMICVMGESGSGKTTSMRTLNPDSTYYIDCDKKGLAWKGWRSQYNSEKKNFFSGRDLPKISQILLGVSEKRTDISTIVIDTLNTCMVDKEIKAMNDKDGFGKWIDLTQYVWNICETAATLREDITVIVAMHSETIRDDLGYTFTRIKTNGRKLEKVVLESLFGTVLLAKRTEDGRYVFETQAKNSTAKSPMGAFETFEIDNDMGKVLEALSEF
ncbi:AAA family ATPase [Fumia xinanensis]|uniref:AAA family ATPase n=1 Tax=Fumia xinanensis TaxID=2763659 RepID=A0A926I5H4_9FIRM|nr:AAA family ATPase [Fumia xinanensis]MBC8558870.1 AAA family ATPase [Fumia xinanensis]